VISKQNSFQLPFEVFECRDVTYLEDAGESHPEVNRREDMGYGWKSDTIANPDDPVDNSVVVDFDRVPDEGDRRQPADEQRQRHRYCRHPSTTHQKLLRRRRRSRYRSRHRRVDRKFDTVRHPFPPTPIGNGDCASVVDSDATRRCQNQAERDVIGGMETVACRV